MLLGNRQAWLKGASRRGVSAELCLTHSYSLYAATLLDAVAALCCYLTAVRTWMDVGHIFGWSDAKACAVVRETAQQM